MRCQMHTKALANHFDDLIRQRVLEFRGPVFGDEERPVGVGVEPRQDMLAVPAYAPGYVFRDFGDKVLSLGLGFRRRGCGAGDGPWARPAR